MAWKEKRKGIARHDSTHGPRSFRTADLRRDPRVRANFARRNTRRGAKRRLFERRQIADVDQRVVDRPRAKESVKYADEPSRSFARHDATVQPAFGSLDDFVERVSGIEADVSDAIAFEADVEPPERRRHSREHNRQILLAFDGGDVLNDLLRQIAGRLGLRKARKAVRDALILLVHLLARWARAQMGVNGLLQRGLTFAAKLVPQRLDVTTTHATGLLRGQIVRFEGRECGAECARPGGREI